MLVAVVVIWLIGYLSQKPACHLVTVGTRCSVPFLSLHFLHLDNSLSSHWLLAAVMLLSRPYCYPTCFPIFVIISNCLLVYLWMDSFWIWNSILCA
jgi:hypothetical protein